MKAYDEAEKAKSQSRRWWEMQSDSDDDRPTRPARFRQSGDEAKSQHKKGKHKRKKSKREKHAKKAQKVRVDKTVEIVDLLPVDSAGHDEIVYVNAEGDTPQKTTSMGEEVREALTTQQAVLAESQAMAEKKQ